MQREHDRLDSRVALRCESDQSGGDRHGAHPYPARRPSREPTDSIERVRGQRDQSADKERVRHPRGRHFSSFSRSASSRRIRSSSILLSPRSETSCANMRSAEPWKTASRMRASALLPARSAFTVG